MVEIFRGYVQTINKKPIQKFKGVKDLPTLEEVSKYEEYAGILNNDFTVMDVDDGIEAQKTFDLIKGERINCKVVKTTRGMHFIFRKNDYASKGNTHQTNALGFTFDIRTGENQYIVVKRGRAVRETLQDFDESREIAFYPKFFAPIRSEAKFTSKKDGDGRNGLLFTHLITLRRCGFSKEECVKVINLINDYAFDEPLGDGEIAQICRDDAFKEIEVSSAQDDFGGFGMKPKNYSDVAMAELFANSYRETIRYNEGTSWLVWNGRKWEISELSAQQKYIEFINKLLANAKSELSDAYGSSTPTDKNEDGIKSASLYYKYILKMCDSGKVAGVMKLARGFMRVEINELDANPFDLNTPNGIVDLKTGELKEHSSTAMCTKMTACPSSGKGEKRWKEFLAMICQDDDELERYLKSIAGAIAIGKVYHEALIIAHGDGLNGKSTLFNTIAKVLGDYAGKIPAEALTTRAKNTKVDLAELLGKRFILASETEEGQRLSTSMLKQIASVDSITAEKKYHDPFTFEPTHQVVLYTNFLPKVASSDRGTWRRIVVAPFNAVIDRPKKDYAEKLYDDSSEAILKWIIEGAKDFIDSGYNLPHCKAVDDAIKEYRSDNDWLASFLNDCCLVGDLESASGGILYRTYKDWANEVGEYALRNRDFAQALKIAGFKSKKTNKGTLWQGLSILPEKSMATEEFL